MIQAKQHSNRIYFSGEGFSLEMNQANGMYQTAIKFDLLLFEKQKFELIRSRNFEFRQSWEIKESEVPKNIFVLFDQLDITWDEEFFFESREEIMDLALINKYFTRVNTQFKVKKKESWTERLIFRGNSFSLKWKLGGNRDIKFIAQNVDTENTGEPWSKRGKGVMLYKADNLRVVHSKLKK